MTQKTAQQSMTTFNFKMNVTFFKELIRWKNLDSKGKDLFSQIVQLLVINNDEDPHVLSVGDIHGVDEVYT